MLTKQAVKMLVMAGLGLLFCLGTTGRGLAQALEQVGGQSEGELTVTVSDDPALADAADQEADESWPSFADPGPRTVQIFLPFVLGATAEAGQVLASHSNTTRFTLDFLKLKCVEETDWDQGTASDEPYVIFFVANSRTGTGLVKRTAKFTDVDTGDVRTRLAQPRLWGLNNVATPIVVASDMIVLAAVMENDSSEPSEIVTGLQPVLLANWLAYRAAGLDRATIVSNLRRDMNNSIDMLAVASGFDNPDDRLGGTLELPLTHTNLDNAAAGLIVDLSLRFRDDAEDATYQVYFRLDVP